MSEARGLYQILPPGPWDSFEKLCANAPLGTPERLYFDHVIANRPEEVDPMEMDSYYELRFSDGTSEKLDGVGTLESAKATAKTVFSLTGRKGQLVKVQPIDHTAPARTRGTDSAG